MNQIKCDRCPKTCTAIYVFDSIKISIEFGSGSKKDVVLCFCCFNDLQFEDFMKAIPSVETQIDQ